MTWPESLAMVWHDKLTHFAHRSGQSHYERCPRLWYWGYVWDGIGLSRTRIYVPLARGIFVHRGLERILLGDSIDDAIKFTLEAYDKEVGARGLEVGNLEESSYVYKEQRAHVEALLYGWWKKRWPELTERYYVLEVEHEEVWEVGEFPIEVPADFPEVNCKLVWLGKADALLREKDSGDLYLQSFKTAGEWDPRKDSAGMHDIQGLSELCAVEHRLARWWEDIQAAKSTITPGTTFDFVKDSDRTEADRKVVEYLINCPEPPKIMGIRMEHLLAGTRMDPGKGPRKTGKKIQYSPLIRGYKKDGITPETDEYAWKYSYFDDAGSEHRLGKGWVPFNAWEANGGVRAWIDMLANGMVQADLGDCLEQQFVYPTPYYRQAEDVEDWLQQMIAEELRKAEAVQRLKASVDDNERKFVLNTLFPQFRHSCDYPRLCDMSELCFSPGYAENPEGSGVYRRRDPHHQAEATALVQIEGSGE